MATATSPATHSSPLTIPVTVSDQSPITETDPGTVMAAQISHNVVNGPESASAAAPAGVAENQTTSNAAFNGTQASNIENANPESLINLESSKQANTDSANSAADPSAGDAGEKAAQAPMTRGSEEMDGKDGASQNTEGNGAHEGEVNNGVPPRNDASTPDPSVDHSVNSDAGSGKEDKDDKHHARTNSVKKPTTFSKVSITKSFMAKAASPVPTTAKLGEKPSPVGTPAQPVARPRLIAKTGSGLQNMQKPRLGSESASGPDGRTVWNKNQPTPQPPPKQFTDEELKQQYGIHLATRLQTDEDGKESKWADIDDDEDDWAPEAVVWMDGTKSTLAASDLPPVEPEQKQTGPQDPQTPKPADGTKPAVAAPKRPIEVGPPKTILKPGIAAQQARQQMNGMGSSDKPSLKAKSPAPTPSRSPWASLPPVDAVSPLTTPAYHPPPIHSSMPSQDVRSYEPHHAPPPAREIAADTFDRSWREGEGGSRELFNSANGRYEPAPEGRRGSMKPERKTSVLQRTSQSGHMPAEPSAAFQTRSSSNQMEGNVPWARRRGSSISQGSLPPGRRISVSKGSDHMPMPRRGSTAISQDAQSPQMARAEPARPSFSQQSAWDQQMPPRPEGSAETEDPVQVQERVMREKRAQRELAIQRRKENEEREEKEKQERLRAKLAALGGSGLSRKEREAEAAATQASAKPAELVPTTSEQSPSDKAAQPSIPTGPAADNNKGPMTVAAPVPAAQEGNLPNLAQLPTKPQVERNASSADHAERLARSHLSPKTSNRAPFGQQTSPFNSKVPSSSFSSPGDRKGQGFGQSMLGNGDPFAPWGATSSNGNVWGSSGIGNGTFEKASSFAPMPISQQTSALPLPPGMARPSTSTRISPSAQSQESRSPIVSQAPVTDPLRGFPPGIESRPEASWGQGRAGGLAPAPGLGRPHLPGPIGPPSRSQQQRDVLGAWHATAQRLPQEFGSESLAAENRDLNAPVPESKIKETFKKTSAHGKLGGPRRYEQTEYTIHDAQGSRAVSSHAPLPPNAQSQPGLLAMTSPLSENTVRIPDGSRNPAHGGTSKQPPIGPPGGSVPPHLKRLRAQAAAPDSEDRSVPPPETSTHPVNNGDSTRPNVRLPPPPPVVKLPPQSPNSLMAAAMPVRPAAGYGPPGSRPIVQSEDWQARFNGLFNRAPISTEIPPSPPRTPPKFQDPALAIASSSKAPLHDMPLASSATVSLPGGLGLFAEGFAADDGADVVSKPVIEQMFNEELSFGSLPKIQIPRASNYDAEALSSEAPYNLLNLGTGSNLPKQVEAQTPHTEASARYFGLLWRNPHGIYVNLPSTELNNKLVKHRVAERKAGIVKSPKGHKAKAKNTAPNSPATKGTSEESSKKGSAPASGPSTPANGQKKPYAKPSKGRNTPVKAI